MPSPTNRPPPREAREEVEAIHAAHRLAAAAPPDRVDALGIAPSWAPTQAPSTIGDLAQALFANDRAALSHGWTIRNRRHPLSPP